jgi:hypothetical protein
MGARAINAALAVWLFASSFMWPHTQAQAENAWVVGVMAFIAALSGLSGATWARYFNVVLGIWLVLSGLFLVPRQLGTLLNNILVGIGLVLFGLLSRLTAVSRRRSSFGRADTSGTSGTRTSRSIRR